ncbi:MAG: T9SS type A sorting domain-containing protein [Saprospirales bacterium]|nr:T9SS type A sorting domain-containing protein [Saprospirales bacterium]
MRHRWLPLTLAIIFFPLFSQIKGQSEWAPTGARWHYCQGTGLGEPICGGYFYLEVIADTTIGGRACRKISGYQKNWLNQVTPLPDRFTYAENDSVYYYQPDSNRFLLTFDFSAQAGDTLEFPTPRVFPWDPPDTSFLVRVDSIVRRPAGQDSLRFFYVTPVDWASWWFYGGWYAEKIGGKLIQSPFPIVTIPEIDGFIRCYADDSAFIQFTDEPCDYTLTGWFGQEARWHYGYSSFTYHGYELVEMDGDTLIQAIPCKIFRRTLKKVITAAPFAGIFTETLPPRYAYDIGDRVLVWINDGFYPLYDFNLQPGDTLVFPAQGCASARVYRIDSVGMLELAGVPLRYQRATLLPYGPFDSLSFTIIERIGPVFGHFGPDTLPAGYLFLDEIFSCHIEGPYLEFRCYSDEDILLYNVGPLPCDFIVPADNIPDPAGLSVYPNPASQFLVVRLEYPAVGDRFALTDALGRLVAAGDLPLQENTIDTAGLPAGVYLLSVWTKDGNIVRRIVRQ